jgi:hypothetical protein
MKYADSTMRVLLAADVRGSPESKKGMKKILSLFIFITAFLGASIGGAFTRLYAQEVEGFSLSLGLEGNSYSPSSMAFGLRWGGDYRFSEMWSIGGSGLVCADSEGLTTLEFSGNIRCYFLRGEENLIKYYNWGSLFHLFLQAEGGASSFIAKDRNIQPQFMAGIAAGSRIALSRFSTFYIEPYVRLGYPYIVSVGIVGVYRFPVKGVFW